MSQALLALALFIGVLIAVNLVRVATGPTIYDRLLATNVIGTKALLVLVVAGFLYGRPSLFVDLALVYALLSFVSVVAIARYLEQKRRIQ